MREAIDLQRDSALGALNSGNSGSSRTYTSMLIGVEQLEGNDRRPYIATGNDAVAALGEVEFKNPLLLAKDAFADISPLLGRRQVVIDPGSTAVGRATALALRSRLLKAGIEVVMLGRMRDALDSSSAMYDVPWLTSRIEAATVTAPPVVNRATETASVDTTWGTPPPQFPMIDEIVRRFANEDDLLREPDPPEFLWHGVLPKGDVGLLYAGAKTNKSTLAQHLAAAVAANLPFHGRQTRHGDVLYLTFEDSAPRVQNCLRAHIRYLHAAGQINADQLRSVVEHLHIAEARGSAFRIISAIDDGGRATVPTVAPEVETLIAWMNGASSNWSLVVIDTLARALDGEESNPALSAALKFGDRICAATGAAVLIVHHVGKGAARAGEVGVEAARGGTSLMYGARAAIFMARYDRTQQQSVEAAQAQGIALPTMEEIERLALSGVPSEPDRWARNLVAAIPTALSIAETASPMWFVRTGYDQHPILIPFSHGTTLETARADAANERERQKGLDREAQETRDINQVVDAVRRICAGELGTLRDATTRQIQAASGFGVEKTRRLIASALRRADLRAEPFLQNGKQLERYVLGPSRS